MDQNSYSVYLVRHFHPDQEQQQAKRLLLPTQREMPRLENCKKIKPGVTGMESATVAAHAVMVKRGRKMPDTEGPEGRPREKRCICLLKMLTYNLFPKPQPYRG